MIKKKIIKKYSNINKKDIVYLKKLINRGNYDNYLFEYFTKYLDLHPLDFNVLFYNYNFKHNDYSDGNWLISLSQEEVETIKGDTFKKRYIGYTFEWFILFSNIDNEIRKGGFPDLNIISFNDRFSNFYDKGIMNNIFISSFPNLKKIVYSNFLKEEFYNKIYIAGYHQEQTQLTIINRLLYLLSVFGKKYFKEEEKIKKYLLILFGIMFEANQNSKSNNLININKVLEKLPKEIVKKDDIIEFMNFIGLINYNDYVKKIKENGVEYYFPKESVFNFINKELEIHKTPFIDISFLNDGCYIFDETFLLRIFYKKIEKYIIDNTDNKNKVRNYGDLMEIYVEDFIANWLSYEKENKLQKDKYKIGQGIKFGKGGINGEIDLYIYNKNTKNLIIFELKDRIRLNEYLYRVGELEKLTRKKVERFTNGKIKKIPGEIYKGLEQLLKISNKEKSNVSKIIGVEKINKIEYIFLTHHNSMFWNEIMRYFIDKNKEFEGLNYNFMNLEEYEKLVSLSCRKGIDFFELIDGKKDKYDKNRGFEVIIERFREYNNSEEKFRKEWNPKQLNQDFDVYFHGYYNYNSTDICPFIKTDTIFKSFFNL